MAAATPMMQQYLDIKEQYKDCILFFRLGDFYEMFFSDAEIAARELEITLTGKDCGLEERAPMCGVPFHSADGYVARLIAKGFKVAICEQVEDPAVAKGIVKRDVVKVVTPGTVTDMAMLDDRKNNYLMSICKNGNFYGIAAVDITTGDFYATRITWGNTRGKLLDEIAKYYPSELVVNSEFNKDSEFLSELNIRFSIYISVFEESFFEYGFAADTLRAHFNDFASRVSDYDISVNAAGALLKYLDMTQKVSLSHIQSFNSYNIEEYMILDAATRRNLELTETMREKSKRGSLLWVLDKTMTSMGGRLIRKWIEQPLVNLGDINLRLNAVDEFKNKYMARVEIRELLKRVYDVERLMGKVVLGSVNCRDLTALKNSIDQIPYIKNILSEFEAQYNKDCFEQLDCLEDVSSLIERSVIDDPPITIKEGRIIKDGYNAEVDKLRQASTKGKDWIASLEAAEREKTGIKNLKVGFNKVFGYFIEVTKSYFSLVPQEYIRKQTLANCERYITPELKEIEDTILGAEEKIVQLEYSLFIEIKEAISIQLTRIKQTARALAELDALAALAEVADRESYCKPEVTAADEIEIIDGRHPVVEKMMDKSSFVPNDTMLNMEEDRLSIITGPNMAGKSTYMRQTALIVLMAQIGSFVPAASAKVGIADRIFTRVGASDDLASGQSTFMVEMSEVANILKNATGKSLLILDEIGRGTSTFDGLSIAWAVIEYIVNKENLGCRTLFATHYHELTELEGKQSGIKNYCITVKEKGEDVIFLRKIIRGGADGSYGIQVARLAGVPLSVIDRAKEILFELDDADVTKKSKLTKVKKQLEGQMDLFAAAAKASQNNEVLEDIMKIDLSRLTPIDAMNILYDLQRKMNA
ncbi:DNA mismatch repair protein MutS [Ruminiclostridium sufflavum DSM 19573]|uniref:DNA mismatch repair protein MutS n=1 Tax=Ruminiclostridium sufflavum DSM 19573 TaxID=1121337 RepID=A0A318XJU6_9FIRM|nr:DNA mismatch repair protein MutS [Ruminiclostridium sufflavum]PYG87545.1 DNA mismatch repair protein MutS [Ruminiclostridium sufflavum DSM 19573]